uniref:Uncharacterized protein n=1 Tax=Geospiza parvula TaxID=87175 RepID=A0A8U8BJG2_GEOPR
MFGGLCPEWRLAPENPAMRRMPPRPKLAPVPASGWFDSASESHNLPPGPGLVSFCFRGKGPLFMFGGLWHQCQLRAGLIVPAGPTICHQGPGLVSFCFRGKARCFMFGGLCPGWPAGS